MTTKITFYTKGSKLYIQHMFLADGEWASGALTDNYNHRHWKSDFRWVANEHCYIGFHKEEDFYIVVTQK